VVDTRQRIVNATTVLLQQRGYGATSIKHITAAAPATVGSIYHFFPGGKTELVAAVVVESAAAYQQLFELITAEADDPADAVAHFFDRAADALVESGFVDICPIGTLAAEVASVDDHLRRVTADAFESWRTAARALLLAGGLEPAEAAALATTVIALVEGSFVLARAQRDADIVRQAGAHARTLVDAARSATNTTASR
jgi:AcrR family transcriptional regulator